MAFLSRRDQSTAASLARTVATRKQSRTDSPTSGIRRVPREVQESVWSMPGGSNECFSNQRVRGPAQAHGPVPRTRSSDARQIGGAHRAGPTYRAATRYFTRGDAADGVYLISRG